MAVLMALMTRSQRSCSVLLGDWAQKEKLLSQSLANAILPISKDEHDQSRLLSDAGSNGAGYPNAPANRRGEQEKVCLKIKLQTTTNLKIMHGSPRPVEPVVSEDSLPLHELFSELKYNFYFFHDFAFCSYFFLISYMLKVFNSPELAPKGQ